MGPPLRAGSAAAQRLHEELLKEEHHLLATSFAPMPKATNTAPMVATTKIQVISAIKRHAKMRGGDSLSALRQLGRRRQHLVRDSGLGPAAVVASSSTRSCTNAGRPQR